MEVREVAAQDDGALFLQTHEQRMMSRRITRRAQDHYRAIAEDMLVRGLRLDLAAAAGPGRERSDVGPASGLGAGSAAHSRSPINSVELGSEATWPVWSEWKWLMPMNFTCSGLTLICASCSSCDTFGTLAFVPGW
ncbi:MAG: hypothetical protein ABIO45_00070 [Burkholderiaceae bacterium]